MTSEEMQNTVQFILEQQAQLTVKVDKLSENVDKLTENVDKLAEGQLSYQSRSGQLEESLGMLVQVIRNMDERADTTEKRLDITDERMDATDKRLALLTKTQLSTDKRLALLTESQLNTDKLLALLTQSQKQTDEKLGRLITTVERYISEGSNGKSQG